MIRNLSALGLLVLETDGATFTFDGGAVAMTTPSMAPSTAAHVARPERFGTVPTDSSQIALGRAWVENFEREVMA